MWRHDSGGRRSLPPRTTPSTASPGSTLPRASTPHPLPLAFCIPLVYSLIVVASSFPTWTCASEAAVVRGWALLLGVAPAAPGAAVDLERLVVDAGVLTGTDPALPTPQVMAGWLARYGVAVAKHRLAAIIATVPLHRRVATAAIVAAAIDAGGPPDLSLALRACGTRPGDLPDPTPPPPEHRVLGANPWLRDRMLRKGDLRCSIVECLRFDAKGVVPSCATLATLTGTTRAAVIKALRSLYAEGDVTIRPREGSRRDYEVRLAHLGSPA